MSDDKSSGGLGDRSEERSAQIAARRERDKELAAAIRTGDPRAARRAVNAWGDHVYDWARTHGLGTQDAEQVVVATFTAAGKVLRAGSASDLAVVVFRAARAQLAGSTARRASRRSAHGPTAEDRLCRAVDLHAIAAEPEVASIMWDTADVLGERVRDLADLVYRHGLTPEEAGEVLGVPPDKAADLGKKLPTGFANTARTRVLWRGGEPEDAELAQALTDATAEGYGADAVRVINAHVKTSARSRARALMALPPIEVFGAIPVASLPDGDARDAAATALLGEDEEEAAGAGTGAAAAATGLAGAAAAGAGTAAAAAETTDAAAEEKTAAEAKTDATPTEDRGTGTKAAVAGAAAAAGLAGAGIAAAKAGDDADGDDTSAGDGAGDDTAGGADTSAGDDTAGGKAAGDEAGAGLAGAASGGDAGASATDGAATSSDAAEAGDESTDATAVGDETTDAEETGRGTGAKVAAGAAGVAGAALLGGAAAEAAGADEGGDTSGDDGADAGDDTAGEDVAASGADSDTKAADDTKTTGDTKAADDTKATGDEGGDDAGPLVPAAAGAATVPALAALSSDAGDKPKLRPGEEFLDEEGTTAKKWWIPVAAVAGVLLVILVIVLATRGGSKEEVNAGPAPSAFDPNGPRETTTTRSPGVAPTTASTAPSTTSSTESTTTTVPETTTTTAATGGLGGLGGGGTGGGGAAGGGGSTGGGSTGGGGLPIPPPTTPAPQFQWAQAPTIQVLGSTTPARPAFLAGSVGQASVSWSLVAAPGSDFGFQIVDDMGNTLAQGSGPNATGTKPLCQGQAISVCYPGGPAPNGRQHWVQYIVFTNTGLRITNTANFFVVNP